ncbi:permease family-domain-containing protein [Tuber borchii]|uniref:Permease family-domain-containing protein n=1 Tax=Tuber borchii TaxID=42251 RepID=A0A2T6ZBY1_TUBBO|nr:permease family-domain-containing protein [Tuber borchii]
MTEPDQIVPSLARKSAFGDHARRVKKAFLTKEGLIGSYDYAFLFRPRIPFMRRPRRSAPFFGLDDRMPVLLALLLGFQHALAMLAGIVSPPILLGGAGGANLSAEAQRYLVSTALIVCGILSTIQITRFHIWGTPYYVGTGLISVVGTSFAIIPVALGALDQMYANGKGPMGKDNIRLPCPEGYGAILGTGCVCALLEIALSFMPPRFLKKIFPPLVTGPTVMLVGVKLIASGFKNWAGGNGPCSAMPKTGPYSLCPSTAGPHALPWGSAEFIGLGFSVFFAIIVCERFGSPIMQSTSIIIGLLFGCIIAAATGYFSKASIDQAPAVSFIWVQTFKLSIYGPLVLPTLAVYIILACEAIGDISATCDVSKLDVEGKMFDSRIQGGLLADGINGLLASLATITPMSTYAQNNGVIALTRCANRRAGYACCFFLIIMGIFSKFAASLVAIPSAVLGGMTTFLFCSVAVSGMRITATMPFTRRNRFILTAALALGYGATLVPNWFDYFFTYKGGGGLQGLLDAINLIMETGFAITAFIAMFLNLILPEEVEESDEEVPIESSNNSNAQELGSESLGRGAEKV